MNDWPEPYSYAWWKLVWSGTLTILVSVWGTLKWANRKRISFDKTLTSIRASLADQGKRITDLEAERTSARPFCHVQKEVIVSSVKTEIQRELTFHQESISDLKETISEHIRLLGSANVNLAILSQSVASIEKAISEDLKPEIKSINTRLDRRIHDSIFADPLFNRRSTDIKED